MKPVNVDCLNEMKKKSILGIHIVIELKLVKYVHVHLNVLCLITYNTFINLIMTGKKSDYI